MTTADFSAIEIRIETIEVDGLSHDEEPRFRHDVERELTRLVTERGLPHGVPESRALISTTTPDRSTGQDSVAVSVASAVYQALTT